MIKGMKGYVYIKKNSPTGTLRGMEVGEEMNIYAKFAKPEQVRTAAYRLKKSGYRFACSVRGRKDGIFVKRVK